MPRKYTFTDHRNPSKVLYETTQPNHVSDTEVYDLFKKKTGRDFRVEKALINLEIKMVREK